MITFEEVGYVEWGDAGLPYDEAHCESCDAPVGPYLAVDPHTGGDRLSWSTVYRATNGVETRLYCEDCAQAPVDGEWFAPRQGGEGTVGIILGYTEQGEVEYSYGGPDLTATTPEESFFLHVLGSWESQPC